MYLNNSLLNDIHFWDFWEKISKNKNTGPPKSKPCNVLCWILIVVK